MQLKSEDIIHSLSQQKSTEGLWNQALNHLESMGFDRVVFLRGTVDDMQVSTNFKASWTDHYIEQGYMDKDPFIRYCATNLHHVRTGIDHLEDHHYLTDDESIIIKEASEMGFKSGFSNTIKPFNGRELSAWNIGSSLNRTEVDKILNEQLLSLKLISCYASIFDEQFSSQVTTTYQEQILTDKERQCLELNAKGLRNKEIAHHLKRSEATIEFHLRNARKKLNAKTREHAVLIAVTQHLIDL